MTFRLRIRAALGFLAGASIVSLQSIAGVDSAQPPLVPDQARVMIERPGELPMTPRPDVQIAACKDSGYSCDKNSECCTGKCEVLVCR